MSSVEHFSGYEVIRAAMEVERNGHRFYSSMAEKSGEPLLRELFSWLAQDEVEHLRRLNTLEENFEDGNFWEDADEFVPYLQQFRDSEIFPSVEQLEKVMQEENADLKVLDLAIEAEEMFAAYFHKAEAAARTADGKDAFAWLAGEEERHAKVLKERRETLVGKSV